MERGNGNLNGTRLGIHEHLSPRLAPLLQHRLNTSPWVLQSLTGSWGTGLKAELSMVRKRSVLTVGWKSGNNSPLGEQNLLEGRGKECYLAAAGKKKLLLRSLPL